MDTRKIPLLVTLSAGLSAAIVTYLGHYELKDSLVTILLVLIGFYIFGCVIKLIFDKAGMTTEAVEERQKQEEKAKQEEAERLAEEEAAKLENEDGSVIEKDHET